MEKIEEQSQVLLEKGGAARFVDKRRDSGEVANLVEGLRDAITRYQVSESWFFASNTTYTARQISQHQAIYEQLQTIRERQQAIREQQTIREQQRKIHNQITDLAVRVFWLVFIVYTDD